MALPVIFGNFYGRTGRPYPWGFIYQKLIDMGASPQDVEFERKRYYQEIHKMSDEDWQKATTKEDKVKADLYHAGYDWTSKIGAGIGEGVETLFGGIDSLLKKTLGTIPQNQVVHPRAAGLETVARLGHNLKNAMEDLSWEAGIPQTVPEKISSFTASVAGEGAAMAVPMALTAGTSASLGAAARLPAIAARINALSKGMRIAGGLAAGTTAMGAGFSGYEHLREEAGTVRPGEPGEAERIQKAWQFAGIAVPFGAAGSALARALPPGKMLEKGIEAGLRGEGFSRLMGASADIKWAETLAKKSQNLRRFQNAGHMAGMFAGGSTAALAEGATPKEAALSGLSLSMYSIPGFFGKAKQFGDRDFAAAGMRELRDRWGTRGFAMQREVYSAIRGEAAKPQTKKEKAIDLLTRPEERRDVEDVEARGKIYSFIDEFKKKNNRLPDANEMANAGVISGPNERAQRDQLIGEWAIDNRIANTFEDVMAIVDGAVEFVKSGEKTSIREKTPIQAAIEISPGIPSVPPSMKGVTPEELKKRIFKLFDEGRIQDAPLTISEWMKETKVSKYTPEQMSKMFYDQWFKESYDNKQQSITKGSQKPAESKATESALAPGIEAPTNRQEFRSQFENAMTEMGMDPGTRQVVGDWMSELMDRVAGVAQVLEPGKFSESKFWRDTTTMTSRDRDAIQKIQTIYKTIKSDIKKSDPRKGDAEVENEAQDRMKRMAGAFIAPREMASTGTTLFMMPDNPVATILHELQGHRLIHALPAKMKWAMINEFRRDHKGLYAMNMARYSKFINDQLGSGTWTRDDLADFIMIGNVSNKRWAQSPLSEQFAGIVNAAMTRNLGELRGRLKGESADLFFSLMSALNPRAQTELGKFETVAEQFGRRAEVGSRTIAVLGALADPKRASTLIENLGSDASAELAIGDIQRWSQLRKGERPTPGEGVSPATIFFEDLLAFQQPTKADASSIESAKARLKTTEKKIPEDYTLPKAQLLTTPIPQTHRGYYLKHKTPGVIESFRLSDRPKTGLAELKAIGNRFDIAQRQLQEDAISPRYRIIGDLVRKGYSRTAVARNILFGAKTFRDILSPFVGDESQLKNTSRTVSSILNERTAGTTFDTRVKRISASVLEAIARSRGENLAIDPSRIHVQQTRDKTNLVLLVDPSKGEKMPSKETMDIARKALLETSKQVNRYQSDVFDVPFTSSRAWDLNAYSKKPIREGEKQIFEGIDTFSTPDGSDVMAIERPNSKDEFRERTRAVIEVFRDRLSTRLGMTPEEYDVIRDVLPNLYADLMENHFELVKPFLGDMVLDNPWNNAFIWSSSEREAGTHMAEAVTRMPELANQSSAETAGGVAFFLKAKSGRIMTSKLKDSYLIMDAPQFSPLETIEHELSHTFQFSAHPLVNVMLARDAVLHHMSELVSFLNIDLPGVMGAVGGYQRLKDYLKFRATEPLIAKDAEREVNRLRQIEWQQRNQIPGAGKTIWDTSEYERRGGVDSPEALAELTKRLDLGTLANNMGEFANGYLMTILRHPEIYEQYITTPRGKAIVGNIKKLNKVLDKYRSKEYDKRGTNAADLVRQIEGSDGQLKPEFEMPGFQFRERAALYAKILIDGDTKLNLDLGRHFETPGSLLVMYPHIQKQYQRMTNQPGYPGWLSMGDRAGKATEYVMNNLSDEKIPDVRKFLDRIETEKRPDDVFSIESGIPVRESDVFAIEGVPPERQLTINIGARGAVDVEFPSALEKQMFVTAARVHNAFRGKGEWSKMDQYGFDARALDYFERPSKEVMDAAIRYREEVIEQAKAAAAETPEEKRGPIKAQFFPFGPGPKVLARQAAIDAYQNPPTPIKQADSAPVPPPTQKPQPATATEAVLRASAEANGLRPEERTLPDWVRESMIQQGIPLDRVLNDWDLASPEIRSAIMLDPTLTNEQKIALLRTGSPSAVKAAGAAPQRRGRPPKAAGAPPAAPPPSPPGGGGGEPPDGVTFEREPGTVEAEQKRRPLIKRMKTGAILFKPAVGHVGKKALTSTGEKRYIELRKSHKGKIPTAKLDELLSDPANFVDIDTPGSIAKYLVEEPSNDIEHLRNRLGKWLPIVENEFGHYQAGQVLAQVVWDHPRGLQLEIPKVGDREILLPKEVTQTQWAKLWADHLVPLISNVKKEFGSSGLGRQLEMGFYRLVDNENYHRSIFYDSINQALGGTEGVKSRAEMQQLAMALHTGDTKGLSPRIREVYSRISRPIGLMYTAFTERGMDDAANTGFDVWRYLLDRPVMRGLIQWGPNSEYYKRIVEETKKAHPEMSDSLIQGTLDTWISTLASKDKEVRDLIAMRLGTADESVVMDTGPSLPDLKKLSIPADMFSSDIGKALERAAHSVALAISWKENMPWVSATLNMAKSLVPRGSTGHDDLILLENMMRHRAPGQYDFGAEMLSKAQRTLTMAALLGKSVIANPFQIGSHWIQGNTRSLIDGLKDQLRYMGLKSGEQLVKGKAGTELAGIIWNPEANAIIDRFKNSHPFTWTEKLVRQSGLQVGLHYIAGENNGLLDRYLKYKQAVEQAKKSGRALSVEQRNAMKADVLAAEELRKYTLNLEKLVDQITRFGSEESKIEAHETIAGVPAELFYAAARFSRESALPMEQAAVPKSWTTNPLLKFATSLRRFGLHQFIFYRKMMVDPLIEAHNIKVQATKELAQARTPADKIVIGRKVNAELERRKAMLSQAGDRWGKAAVFAPLAGSFIQSLWKALVGDWDQSVYHQLYEVVTGDEENQLATIAKNFAESAVSVGLFGAVFEGLYNQTSGNRNLISPTTELMGFNADRIRIGVEFVKNLASTGMDIGLMLTSGDAGDIGPKMRKLASSTVLESEQIVPALKILTRGLPQWQAFGVGPIMGKSVRETLSPNSRVTTLRAKLRSAALRQNSDDFNEYARQLQQALEAKARAEGTEAALDKYLYGSVGGEQTPYERYLDRTWGNRGKQPPRP